MCLAFLWELQAKTFPAYTPLKTLGITIISNDDDDAPFICVMENTEKMVGYFLCWERPMAMRGYVNNEVVLVLASSADMVSTNKEINSDSFGATIAEAWGV